MNDNHEKISIQLADFNAGEEINLLEHDNSSDGAVVTFTGRVRAQNDGETVTGLYLEHYPGMTEHALSQIISKAKSRWSIQRITVIHRIGQLAIGDNIVFVGVSSAHRKDAFAGAEFIMDFLKVDAPFWKKETRADGDMWLDAKSTDQNKASEWQ